MSISINLSSTSSLLPENSLWEKKNYVINFEDYGNLFSISKNSKKNHHVSLPPIIPIGYVKPQQKNSLKHCSTHQQPTFTMWSLLTHSLDSGPNILPEKTTATSSADTLLWNFICVRFSTTSIEHPKPCKRSSPNQVFAFSQVRVTHNPTCAYHSFSHTTPTDSRVCLINVSS